MSASVSPDLLARFQPLHALGPENLEDLAMLCRRECIDRGVRPLGLEQWRGQMVYLAKGELKLDFSDGSFQVLVGGTGAALMPLGRGGKAPVSARIITDVELLHFDEDAIETVLTWNQIATDRATDAGGNGDTDWRTMSGMFAVRNLTQGAFAALPPANIETLLGRFQRVRVKRGEVVIRQGDPGDYYYLIERGRCLVTREVSGARVELAELTGGDVFGEEALVFDAPRNATVKMKTDGILLRLRKEDFVELLREPLLQRLSPADAKRKAAEGAVWVDVRFPAEYRQSGLPGAVNIPLNEIRHAMHLLDPSKEYLVYCQTGRRSAAAAFLFSQRGFRAYLLEGGLRAIEDTGETVKGEAGK